MSGRYFTGTVRIEIDDPHAIWRAAAADYMAQNPRCPFSDFIDDHGSEDEPIIETCLAHLLLSGASPGVPAGYAVEDVSVVDREG